MKGTTPLARIAALALRITLALSFLSAVADRFGLWGPPGTANVAWGTFDEFLKYTGLLLWFLPPAIVPVAGWVATASEVILAIGLLSGFYLRWFALGSSLLLASFGASMTLSLGLEPAFSYSVWTGAAAAFLLSCLSDRREVST